MSVVKVMRMVIMKNSKIKNEWEKFYRESGEGIGRTDKHFDDFGNMMVELIKHFGKVSNMLWSCILPSVTEDRMWYRVYQKIEDERKFNIYFLEGGCEVDMLLDIYQIGWIKKSIIGKVIDWRQIDWKKGLTNVS